MHNYACNNPCGGCFHSSCYECPDFYTNLNDFPHNLDLGMDENDFYNYSKSDGVDSYRMDAKFVDTSQAKSVKCNKKINTCLYKCPCCNRTVNYCPQKLNDNCCYKCPYCSTDIKHFHEPYLMDVKCEDNHANMRSFVCPICHTNISYYPNQVDENFCYDCPKCGTDIKYYFDEQRRFSFDQSVRRNSLNSHKFPDEFTSNDDDWFTRLLKHQVEQINEENEGFTDAWWNEIYKLLVLENHFNPKGHKKKTSSQDSLTDYNAISKFSKKWMNHHSKNYNSTVSPDSLNQFPERDFSAEEEFRKFKAAKASTNDKKSSQNRRLRFNSSNQRFFYKQRASHEAHAKKHQKSEHSEEDNIDDEQNQHIWNPFERKSFHNMGEEEDSRAPSISSRLSQIPAVRYSTSSFTSLLTLNQQQSKFKSSKLHFED